MNAPNLNLPPGVAVADLPDAPDLHPELRDWSALDPKGFEDAVRDAVDADDLMANVVEAAERGRAIHFDERWREALTARMQRDVNAMAAWVKRYAERFED